LASIAESESAGGGGGYKPSEQTPLYQQGVRACKLSAVPYLTPTDPQTFYGSARHLADRVNFKPRLR